MSSNRLIYFESPHRNFGSTVEIRYSFITELSGIPSLIFSYSRPLSIFPEGIRAGAEANLLQDLIADLWTVDVVNDIGSISSIELLNANVLVGLESFATSGRAVGCLQGPAVGLSNLLVQNNNLTLLVYVTSDCNPCCSPQTHH